MSWGKTDQESRLDAVFAGLEADFKRLDKARDPAKAQALVKDVTAKLKDAKALIQEFEREARTDGMPNRELADRKRKLVNQFNTFVNDKKQYSSTESGRGELLAGATGGQGEATAAGDGAATDGQTMQELMKDGRKGVKEIHGTLHRAEKLVEDTLQIGQQTAATLHDQTQQLNKIVDDLNEIEFTMKKATKIIADIGKGIMTDRCIMFLLFLVVCGVIALVVVKVVKPNQAAIQAATASITPEAVTNFTNTVTTAVQNAFTRHRHRRALLLDRQAVWVMQGQGPAKPRQWQQQQPQHAQSSVINKAAGFIQKHQQQHQQQQHRGSPSGVWVLPASCTKKLAQFCAAAAVRLGMEPTD